MYSKSIELLVSMYVSRCHAFLRYIYIYTYIINLLLYSNIDCMYGLQFSPQLENDKIAVLVISQVILV